MYLSFFRKSRTGALQKTRQVDGLTRFAFINMGSWLLVVAKIKNTLIEMTQHRYEMT